MGFGVNGRVQVPQKLHDAGVKTVLVGKVADIALNPHGISYQNLVDTQQIMDITLEEVQKPGDVFICTNIQETDLAGHAQDVARYADRLEVVDTNLARLMNALQPGDCLVVMADHGNDPTIGHSKHTRENVPLLVWQPGISHSYLGARKTLSDVGATVCEFFAASAPQNGTSFLSLLNTSNTGGNHG
ncbi:Phosphopentomutase [compost metagenome]